VESATDILVVEDDRWMARERGKSMLGPGVASAAEFETNWAAGFSASRWLAHHRTSPSDGWPNRSLYRFGSLPPSVRLARPCSSAGRAGDFAATRLAGRTRLY